MSLPAAQKVCLKEVPDDELRDVLTALLDQLGMVVYRDQTPEYTLYEVRPLFGEEL
jgi:hypothetical protein